ncbi:MAG: decarboxylating 6-phosphogluconate dehydrogenase [Phycisphaerae bacterium]|nr:decarboxylating 6-phosphogluconate dehydrogenase [Phycisphaerae bacterium]
MQIGMLGLGRMGGGMVRRLMKNGHQCVVYDVHPEAVAALVKEGAVGATSAADFMKKLTKPRAAWMMIPVAFVDKTIADLVQYAEPGDILIDGGNSYYKDDLRRATELAQRQLHYVDVGVSGGVWGAERGFCQMIGGEPDTIARLEPIFRALAPAYETAPPTPGREASKSTAEHGYLHCGPCGAGHFVKMVHNGIEYALMASYAEGLNILKHANAGLKSRTIDAETTPLRNPEEFQYNFNVGDITELWRRGSVVGSWLLDLTAQVLTDDPELAKFTGRVSDSGEGRWTVLAAIEEGVPAHVLSAALFDRFESRGAADFANKVLSAQRFMFGGHHEKKA